MITLGDIEDGLEQALAGLHVSRGGPLRTLQTSGAYSIEDALQESANRVAPSCLVVMVEVQHSALRPNLRYESTHTPALLLAARSFRNRQTAAKGDAERVGVYDLLAATRQALLGRVLFGPQSGEIGLARERLMVSSPTLVVWAQEWNVTIFN